MSDPRDARATRGVYDVDQRRDVIPPSTVGVICPSISTGRWTPKQM